MKAFGIALFAFGLILQLGVPVGIVPFPPDPIIGIPGHFFVLFFAMALLCAGYAFLYFGWFRGEAKRLDGENQ